MEWEYRARKGERSMLIKCHFCGQEFGQLTDKHMKSKHGISLASYRLKYPEQKVLCEESAKVLGGKVANNSMRNLHISQALRGREITWGDKISEVKKGQPNAIAGWNRGLTKETNEIVAKMASNPERIEKIRQANIGREITWADKISKTKIEQCKDPEYLRKMMTRFGNHQTKPEILMEKILDESYPNEWMYTGDGSITIMGKSSDFLHISGLFVIEVFGRYWHSINDIKIRTDFFEDLKIAILIFWEDELLDKQFVVNKIAEKIKSFSSVETLHETSISGNCN